MHKTVNGRLKVTINECKEPSTRQYPQRNDLHIKQYINQKFEYNNLPHFGRTSLSLIYIDVTKNT
jgi:hypothetical protein